MLPCCGNIYNIYDSQHGCVCCWLLEPNQTSKHGQFAITRGSIHLTQRMRKGWWWYHNSNIPSQIKYSGSLDNIWVMLSSHYGTWWVKQTPEAKPCTVHDKFAMESEGAAWYCWNAARVNQLMSQPLSERTICSNCSRRTDRLGCSGKCSKVAQAEAVGRRDGPPLQKHQRRTAARDPKQPATQCDEGLPEHFRAAARC